MNKERFKTLVRLHESGCWLWQLGTRLGYGSTRHNGKTQFAHRVSYQLYKGDIPVGMMILHTCDIKLCVNPDHLRLGTAKDNSIDYWNRDGIHYNSVKITCKYGHLLDGENLMIDNRGDRLCRECNRRRSSEWRAAKRGLSI